MNRASRRTAMSSQLTVCTSPVYRAVARIRRPRATGVLLLVLALALGLPASGLALAAPAAAAEPPLGELIELNKRAVLDHSAGRHDAAATSLQAALALAEKSGLGAHDMAARTHIHLGIVLIAGL